MTRRRWIADDVSGDRAFLRGDHAQHLATVLRAQIGQQFDIVTPDGVRSGKVSAIRPDSVEFDLGEAIEEEALRPLVLALAVFKFDRMEWAIEKCTELGVSQIVPVIARRSDKHLVQAANKRGKRWERIAQQAAEQSRRTAPPRIATPIKCSELISQTNGARVVLSEEKNQPPMTGVLTEFSASDELTLAVGPEGGWAEEELDMFNSSGWIATGLGNTILRAETAAIAATAIAVFHR